MKKVYISDTAFVIIILMFLVASVFVEYPQLFLLISAVLSFHIIERRYRRNTSKPVDMDALQRTRRRVTVVASAALVGLLSWPVILMVMHVGKGFAGEALILSDFIVPTVIAIIVGMVTWCMIRLLIAGSRKL